MEAEEKTQKTPEGELIIEVENRNLEQKYEELIQEIAEKSAAMDNNVEEKHKETSNLEVKVQEQLQA